MRVFTDSDSDSDSEMDLSQQPKTGKVSNRKGEEEVGPSLSVLRSSANAGGRDG